MDFKFVKKTRGKFNGFLKFFLVVSLCVFTSIQAMAVNGDNTVTGDQADGPLKTVTGTIVDDTGEPMPGVSVLLKGTTTGTITDFDGNYSISNVPEDAVLVFSFVGMATQELSVSGVTKLNVALASELIGLNEVVAVGYGTQKKANVTGAVTGIKSDELSKINATNVSSQLQGIASGVTVVQSSGQPGDDAGSINIRGIGSINNTDPLVLIDGSEGSINDVDPNDIESMSVLKDAAASSIYGVRAANGVILITTKGGEEGKIHVSYNGYVGFQRATQIPDFVGAQKYMKLVNLLKENSGGTADFTDAEIAAYDDPNRDTDLYPDVNWMDEILQGDGFQQEHNVAFSAGNENMKYRLSIGDLQQDGLVKKANYNRTTIRLNSSMKLFKNFNITANASLKHSKQTEPEGTDGGIWFQFSQAYIANPTLQNKYSDGTWGIVRGDGNPVRLQDEGGQYTYKENVLTGNFKADWDVVKGLKLTGIANLAYTEDYEKLYEKSLTYTDFYSGDETIKGSDELTNYYGNEWDTNLQGLVSYDLNVNDHGIKVLLGVQRINNDYSSFNAYRSGNLLDQFSELSAGDPDTETNTGTSKSEGLLSYFGRLNYSYKGKYLVEANVRRDGSSHFSEENRWGTFPSFSAGWRITEESFMESTRNYLDNLKLRLSWGQLGNQDVTGDDLLPYQSKYTLDKNYPFGNTLTSGSKLGTAANEDISWETTEMSDIGLDFTFLSGKIDGTFDYYIKDTKDILYELDIPATVGLSAPTQNVGSMRNKGWEFSLAYKGSVGSDFKYSVRGTLSDVKNEIRDFDGVTEITTSTYYTTIMKKGLPFGAYYGYICDGIFQTDAEVSGHATQSSGNVAPGDLKFRDIDDSGTIDSGDRTVIGSSIPRYNYSINLNASYKNWDFTALFQGVGKVDVNTWQANQAPTDADGNFKSLHEDSWTTDNTDAAYPRLINKDYNNVMSSFWIKSGSYLRLKNCQLGYSLPKTLIERAGIEKCRFYLSGQNLFTFSGLNKYDIDPEMPGDARYYPQVKTYMFGVNVNF